jgi:RNA polymerase sigma-70 factor (ECF subfamily)
MQANPACVTGQVMASESDEELLRHARTGEERAFREIVERCQDGLFSLTAAIAGSAGPADDIAQGVFAKLYRSLPRAGFRPSLAAWIHRTGMSESFDYLRQHRDRDKSGRLEDRRAAVIRLLANLPEEERDLLILREMQGRPVGELARIMDTSVETVSAMLLQARQGLVKQAASAGMLDQSVHGSSTRPTPR